MVLNNTRALAWAIGGNLLNPDTLFKIHIIDKEFRIAKNASDVLNKTKKKTVWRRIWKFLQARKLVLLGNFLKQKLRLRSPILSEHCYVIWISWGCSYLFALCYFKTFATEVRVPLNHAWFLFCVGSLLLIAGRFYILNEHLHFKSVSAQSNTKYPTLIHFGAAYGLPLTVAACLQYCPVARQACALRNKDGMYPKEIAEKHGHYKIAADIQCYQVT